ncbi:MAG: cytochrome C oxidase subunit IV family protein [Acidimicrobiales bacterium]
MTTTDVSVTDDTISDHDVEGPVHEHPSDMDYVKIAAILGVITAAEVATYFWEGASTATLVAVLFPMMIAKFMIVAGYFMHLKYDNPIFKRVFVFGLLLAVVVYMILFFSLQFWDGEYPKYLQGE